MIQYRIVSVWQCPVSEVCVIWICGISAEDPICLQFACIYSWGDVKFLRDVENAINECSEVS